MNGLEALGYEFEFENECITIYKSKDGLSRIYYNDCEAWKDTKKKKFTRAPLYASEIEALNELMNDNKEKKLLNLLKEKKVDLDLVERICGGTDNILKIAVDYNTCVREERHLTKEEMQLIVEWKSVRINK